jgi:Cu/Ag efflux protein CusF
MRGRARVSLILLASICAASVAVAQRAVEQAGNASKSATIVAIDHTNRIVTLKDSQGTLEDVRCGPEIKRFDELKVGDTVTFSYHVAVVYQILKPGSKESPAAGTGTVRGQGVKPSGAITQQRKATVTVETVDAAVPSLTVRTSDGHKVTARVEDRKNLEGVKAGDQVSITYTEALMITVEAPKK